MSMISRSHFIVVRKASRQRLSLVNAIVSVGLVVVKEVSKTDVDKEHAVRNRASETYSVPIISLLEFFCLAAVVEFRNRCLQMNTFGETSWVSTITVRDMLKIFGRLDRFGATDDR